MQRDYTVAEYEDLVARLRDRIPGLALSTDVIVGFPDESEADFAATEALMQRVRYDSAFLFRYSPREGTRAWKWDDSVPDAEKARRLERLIALQEAIAAERNRALIGCERDVLVEGSAKRPDGWVTGKTPDFRTVVLPGPVAPGEEVRVRIESATSHTLTGRPVA
jgi:tRNA-2-methylthio-N6-dimethylallyladenosine synthase